MARFRLEAKLFMSVGCEKYMFISTLLYLSFSLAFRLVQWQCTLQHNAWNKQMVSLCSWKFADKLCLATQWRSVLRGKILRAQPLCCSNDTAYIGTPTSQPLIWNSCISNYIFTPWRQQIPRILQW